ncbi:MAG: threonine-phosphate decarboxylase [Deltaproteobacteria bacterium]|nr:threonine-phosphate decarboxylase [Deltaproteobacteria bacterium]
MKKDIHGGNIWEASVKGSSSPDSILDFSASINPLGLSPKAQEAIVNALSLIPPYPDPESKAITQAISRYYGLNDENLAVGNGSTEFIYLIPHVFKPKKALIIEPAFSEYAKALRLGGCRVERFTLSPKDSFSLDIDKLKKKLKSGSYNLLYIANPANPSGSVIKKEALIELSKYCASVGTIVVIDEAFADFYGDESIIKEAQTLKNVIVLRSLTKFFSMAGLRLGFTISNKRIIERFKKALPPWSVNTLAAFAGAQALGDNLYIEKTMEWLKDEREFLFSALSSIRDFQVFPSFVNYFLVKITSGHLSSPELKARLFKKGILIRELSAFKGLGPEFFRVAVKSRKDNEELIAAFKAVFVSHPVALKHQGSVRISN